MRRFAFFAVLACLLAGLACSSGEPSGTVSVPPLQALTTIPATPLPDLDKQTVAAGEDLYKRFCASCHGADLAGDPDWQIANDDGSYPPPPQDSTGHTWHHGDELLLELILEGSDFEQSRMPAFGDQLTEADALAILEFFKASWGPRERQFQWEATLREQAQAARGGPSND